MISQNPYSNCMSARLYYYDFLSEESREGIPESTLNHILDCPDCQSEVDRLEALLVNADEGFENQQSLRTSAITTLLKLHFAHVDEPVNCSIIKPFLASLADPVLRIRIPTPITKHIEECPDCRNDLRALLEFHLSHKQLCRLGQLLAEEPAKSTVNCSQAREVIPAVASMVFRGTNAEVLKHLSTCTDCRKELFRHREQLLQKLPDIEQDQATIPCEAVSPSDVYDYAFPYGIDPAEDEYAEFREPLASHLGGCPRCLAKVQELQEKIFRITERPASEVVTVYHIDEPVPAAFENDTDEAQPSRTIHFTERVKQRLRSPGVKPWLKVSAAAAAVILIALIPMFNQTTVQADWRDQMRIAIENARNLRILIFDPDIAEPLQERLVSRSLGFYLLKDKDQIVLYNFTNKLQKVWDRGSNKVQIKELPESMDSKIEGNLAVFLNLLPSTSVYDGQEEANWDRVTDDNQAMDNENYEVCDLVWTDTTSIGASRSYRRRYFIDPKTSFPKKVEFSQKTLENDEFSLISETFVEQVDDSEMKAAVKTAFP